MRAAFASRSPWTAIFGVVFVCAWAGNQFSPLLLMYEARHHYSTVLVNLFLGIYVLGLAPALLISGALSDRYGRRPVLTAGVLTAVAASAVLSLGSLGVAPILIGRLLAGVTVGIAMAVGTSWIKELSQAPFDATADAGAGARRASLAFTLGSALGALVAGLIAQWGPIPEQLPFIIHIVVTLPFLGVVLRAPESVTLGGLPGPLRAQLRVPTASHKRFVRVVAVGAPWIFAAAATGYGYLPVLLRDATGPWGLAYATGLTVATLVIAALVQPLARRLDTVDSARGVLVGIACIAGGIAIVAVADVLQSVLVGLLVALVLGVGMGVGMVSGLLEVQRIAGPRDLAGLTGVFYTFAYAGFLAPTVLAGIASGTGLPTGALLFAVAVLGGLTCLLIVASYRKHLPEPPIEERELAHSGRSAP